MRILFVHSNFPGQYQKLAPALARDPANRVVFATQEAHGSIPGVEKRLYAPMRQPRADIHHYVRPLEQAVLNGQALYRLCRQLKSEGFEPDVVCAHNGWGAGLYVKDAFPDARLLSYFEWFYRAAGSDADFLDGPVGEDDALRIRTLNAGILLDLASCDHGICPTLWQRDQFPAPFQDKLTVLHDGVDTGFFRPDPTARLVLPGTNLSTIPEIVTYATRGMEPYRGFPQFMRAAALLQKRRPGLHIVVGGDDRVAYSRRLPEGQSYRKQMLGELSDLDSSRLHFVGLQPFDSYRRMLQASSCHIYLTVPFVLSWSLLEAMACGCALVGSDTAPVREVMQDGVNGLLADFFSPEDIADRVEEILDRPDRTRALREAARTTVLDSYDLAALLPQQVRLMRFLAESRDAAGAAGGTDPDHRTVA